MARFLKEHKAKQYMLANRVLRMLGMKERWRVWKYEYTPSPIVIDETQPEHLHELLRYDARCKENAKRDTYYGAMLHGYEYLMEPAGE